MRSFRWAFAGVTALMVGSGFAVLAGDFAFTLVSALLVLLVVAHLSRERLPLDRRARNVRCEASAGTSYAAAYGTADGGGASGGGCGTYGDGGGSC